MSAAIRIGVVARESGVSVDTVRFYEKEGLLPNAARSAAGYRLYPPMAVRRLRFIDRAKALGFSLAEVRELLTLGEHRERHMGSLRARIAAKTRIVKKKIEELERIRVALDRLHRQCPGRGPLGKCPILSALEFDETLAATGPHPSSHQNSRRLFRKSPKHGAGVERPSKSKLRSRP